MEDCWLPSQIRKILQAKWHGSQERLQQESFINYITLHMNHVHSKIREGGDRTSLSFSTHGGTSADWKSVEEGLRGLSDMLDFDKLICRGLDTLTKPKVKCFIQSKTLDIRNLLSKTLTQWLQRHSRASNQAETKNIQANLDEGVIYNLTPVADIPAQLRIDFHLGGKFIPHGNTPDNNPSSFVYREIAQSLQRMYSYKGGSFRNNHLKQDITIFAQNPGLDEPDKNFLLNLLERIDSIIPIISIRRQKYVVRLGSINDVSEEGGSDLVILEADKNIGLTILTKSQVMEIYRKTNEEHGYIRSDFTESTYIKTFTKTRNELIPFIPTNLRAKLTKRQIALFHSSEGNVGLLRPMPKLHKLAKADYNHFHLLRSRAIKASSSDPVNHVASVLSTLSKELINDMKSKIKQESGLTTGLNGCDEAFEALNNASNISDHTGHHLNVEGDAHNLYPSLPHQLVRTSIRRIFLEVERSHTFRSFFLTCLYLIMTFNIFMEPDGIYTTNPSKALGFSIGCKFAADGSELVLLLYELILIRRLIKEGLLGFIPILIRFRDDLFIRVQGDITKSLRALRIIALGYPESLRMDFKASPIFGEFLDMSIRSYTNSKPFEICLLRKKLARHDINRPTSNTSSQIKRSALISNAYRAHRRSNNARSKDHQLNVGCMIAVDRGFTKKFWDSILRRVKASGPMKKQGRHQEQYRRRYAGGFSYDEGSKSHLLLTDLFNTCSLPSNYNKPISLPSKSMFQYYHTNRKLLRSMEDFVTAQNSRNLP